MDKDHRDDRGRRTGHLIMEDKPSHPESHFMEYSKGSNRRVQRAGEISPMVDDPNLRIFQIDFKESQVFGFNRLHIIMEFFFLRL